MPSGNSSSHCCQASVSEWEAKSLSAAKVKPASGFVIAEVDIHDLTAFLKYGTKVPETLVPFNHQYLVRSNKIQSLEGDPPKGGIVVIQFESAEKAREWYDSPAYAAIRPIRQSSATSRIYIVEVRSEEHT